MKQLKSSAMKRQSKAVVMTKQQYRKSLLQQKQSLSAKLTKLVEKYHG